MSGTRRRTQRVTAALVLLAICCGLRNGARADEPQPSTQSTSVETSTRPRIAGISAGFAGRFKVGHWTPLEIELDGGTQTVRGRLELIAADGDGVPARVVSPAEGELEVPPGKRTTVPMYAKLGQLDGEVTVRFRASDGPVVTRRYRLQRPGPLAGALPSTVRLIVVLAPEPAKDEPALRPPAGAEIARIDTLGQLPTSWWGYAGVDALVVTTSDDVMASQLAGDSPQMAALGEWVRMGGKLVLSVGAQAEKLLAESSAIRKLAPSGLEAMVPLRQTTLTMLETYAEASESILPAGAIRVPKLALAQGRVEAFDGTSPRDLPLVVRSAYGFGQVVFLAVDLDRPPLAGWSGRAALFDKLLGHAQVRTSDEDRGRIGAVTTLGFTDLSGQLRGALDQFEGVRLAPFWLVASLAIVYIACIGPLDYLLVKYLLRRMESTWLTFALSVALFSAGAVALAYGLKGRDVRANQVDLVDFDSESGLVRGTSWCNVYSPTTSTYNLSLRPSDASDARCGGILFSWFGLTGAGFGGMDVPGGIGGDAATRTMSPFGEPYDYSSRLDQMRGVPIAVWSSKSFVGRWWRSAASPVEAQLTDDGRLRGTLASRLDDSLTDAVLLYDKWAYVIHTLDAGQTVDLEAVDPQTSDTYLRKVTVSGDRQVTAPFDQASFDVPRIVEMMSAQGLAGGEVYTGLTNRYQPFVELTDLIAGGRAVLLARIPRKAARLENDDKPLAEATTRSWTFYRCVLPVKIAGSQ